ncbi:MAG TPA: DUF4261 domain-containing protein [Sandaracinaceae bacterium LLY-WYZ-13_1]|nr:DUF4261 domain-containing protein [Sandaracinaceae bacterium LLY-WYZ-13_1]
MPKGLFTGSTVVLFEAPPSLDSIERALGAFSPRGRREASEGDPWLGGPSVLVEMRAEVHGLATVDVVDRPWPDAMGDPQADPKLFGAWSFGAFGPFVFPGALERAAQHALGWPEADDVAGAHRAFVRARSSYVLGLGDDARVLPDDYDPVAELTFLTDLASALLGLPGALAFFDPSGEVFLSSAALEDLMARRREADLPPLDAWSNVRFFQLGDAAGWGLMDTVGMEQLEVTDQEACFPIDAVSPDEVAPFLRNVSLYLHDRGPVVEDGHTIEGPGGVWRAHACEESLAPAPRPTLRWVPTFAGEPPEGMLPGHGA